MDVTLVLYDSASYLAGTAMFREIRAFVDENAVEPDTRSVYNRYPSVNAARNRYSRATAPHRPDMDEAYEAAEEPDDESFESFCMAPSEDNLQTDAIGVMTLSPESAPSV